MKRIKAIVAIAALTLTLLASMAPAGAQTFRPECGPYEYTTFTGCATRWPYGRFIWPGFGYVRVAGMRV